MQIKVTIDNLANCQSAREELVDLEDLEFESAEDWNAASEDDKMKAVTEYWYGMGVPEISWEKVESGR